MTKGRENCTSWSFRCCIFHPRIKGEFRSATACFSTLKGVPYLPPQAAVSDDSNGSKLEKEKRKGGRKGGRAFFRSWLSKQHNSTPSSRRYVLTYSLTAACISPVVTPPSLSVSPCPTLRCARSGCRGRSVFFLPLSPSPLSPSPFYAPNVVFLSALLQNCLVSKERTFYVLRAGGRSKMMCICGSCCNCLRPLRSGFDRFLLRYPHA